MSKLVFTRKEARLLPRLHERQEIEEADNAMAHPDGPFGVERRAWTGADGVERVALRCPPQREKEARNQLTGFEYADLEAALPHADWINEAGCWAQARTSCADLDEKTSTAMISAGFTIKEIEVWLSGKPSGIEPVAPDVDITMADNAEERALWADIALEGWELPRESHDVARASLAPFPGPAHWRWFIARMDGVAVGEALMVYFDDVDIAYLADAAVVPAGRGKRVQRSLIAARAALAAKEGYSRLFAGATFGSASATNMMRSGLRIQESTVLWMRRPKDG